jgi:thiol-disulfide isomerase/thioredoxin
MIGATFAFLVALLAPPPVEGPFQELTFDQALAAAKRDNKVVMIDYFTTWCGPCKKLDRTTWTDAEVIAWLREKTIALKIDAEKEVELARKHNIAGYPTMIFLKSDGSEVGRLVGYKSAKRFLSEANDALGGKTGVARAKDDLVGHEKDPMARSQYARELTQAGRYEEALAEYLWCFDEGAKAFPSYSGVRVSFLLSDIVQLGQRYPPAIKALEDRRDAAESRLLGESGGSDEDASDAVALNRDLGSPQRTLALYDALKKTKPLSARMRHSFSRELLGPLVDARRYQDAVELFDDPRGYVTWQIKIHRARPKLDQDDESLKAMLAQLEEDQVNELVSECGRVYEALLGIGKPEKAGEVAGDLVQFAPSGATYSTLVDLAVRAGTPDAARSLAEQGLKTLPEAEQGVVREALTRILSTR